MSHLYRQNRELYGAIILWLAAALFAAGCIWGIIGIVLGIGAWGAGVMAIVWIASLVAMLVGGFGFRDWR